MATVEKFQSFWNGYVGAEICPLDDLKEKGELVVKIRKAQIQEFEKIIENNGKKRKRSILG